MSFNVDEVAAGLQRWGRVARTLPRAQWEQGGELYPVVSVTGMRIGRLMPGYGIVLDGDLKRFGITRPIDGVISRTPFARALEKLLRNDGTITSIATLQAAYNNTRQTVPYTVVNAGNSPVGWDYCWTAAGGTFTSVPGSAPTRTNAAAFNGAMIDPPANNTKYLGGVTHIMTGTIGAPFGYGMAVVVDVLVECGNIDFTVITTTTLSTTALTRYTTGVGVMAAWFAQDVIGFGGAISTITVVYVNQAGTAGQTTTFLTDGNSVPGMIISNAGSDDLPQMPLASGDYGIRSITSVQTSLASTTGGGNDHAALHLYKPLVYVQGMEETSCAIERDVRADPTFLQPLATTAGGVLGCLQAYYLSVGAANNFNIGFVFDTLYG